MLSILWETINAEDSLIPILVPLAIWVGAITVCYRRGGKEAFAKCDTVHDFHSIALVLLSFLSIYFNDDTVFNERIVNYFAATYFVVDLFDCIIRRDAPFTVHAAISLALCLGFRFVPAHQRHRTGSKGSMSEISTPQLHVWMRTKTKSDFVKFFLLFTCCRIFWIPLFLIDTYGQIGWLSGDVMMPFCVSFYFLQVFWWIKMTNMLLNYKEKGTEHVK